MKKIGKNWNNDESQPMYTKFKKKSKSVRFKNIGYI